MKRERSVLTSARQPLSYTSAPVHWAAHATVQQYTPPRSTPLPPHTTLARSGQKGGFKCFLGRKGSAKKLLKGPKIFHLFAIRFSHVCLLPMKKDWLPTLLQRRAYKTYSAVGRNTNYSQTLRAPVPMGTTETWRCVWMTRRAGSPPPSSRQPSVRTRTLVSWAPKHMATPQRRTSNYQHPECYKYTWGWLPEVKPTCTHVYKPSALLVQTCFSAERILADAGPVAADSALRKKLTKFLSAFTAQFTCFTSTNVLFSRAHFSQTQGLCQQTAPSGRSWLNSSPSRKRFAQSKTPTGFYSSVYLNYWYKSTNTDAEDSGSAATRDTSAKAGGFAHLSDSALRCRV